MSALRWLRAKVLAAGGFVKRWGSWLEQNKIGLAAVGTAIGAVYNGIVNGADPLTLALAVAAVFGALSHLTSTPLSNPKTSTGIPLVPAPEGPTLTITGLAELPPAKAPDPLDLLPAPSGRKGGRLAKPRDDRDYKAGLPANPPKSVDNGKGLTFGMLLNDRIGDCGPAALLHALQVITAGKYVPSDAQVLTLYEAVGGYRPGDSASDRGTVLRDLLKYARAEGWIGEYAAVPCDPASLRAAVAGHEVVICGWGLPDGAQTEGDHWTVPRKGRQVGSWGGHATVVDGYTRSHVDNVTWGEQGTVSDGFIRDYLEEAWVVTPGSAVPQ